MVEKWVGAGQGHAQFAPQNRKQKTIQKFPPRGTRNWLHPISWSVFNILAIFLTTIL